MDILIIKSIFCPNDTYLQKTFMSIDNLILYTKEYPSYNYKFIIFGWVSKQKYINIIKKKLNNIQALYIINNINYGKMWYIKNISNNYHKYTNKHNYDIIFYSDHDILLKFNQDIFKMFNTIANNKNNIGIISLNQLQDKRHQPSAFLNNTTIENIELASPHPLDYGAIASGCFMISQTCFKLFSNLPLKTVYGLDDFFINELLIKNNYISYILKHIYAIHPFDNNTEYKLWKLKLVDKLINNTNKEFYNKSLQKSINFWNGFS